MGSISSSDLDKEAKFTGDIENVRKQTQEEAEKKQAQDVDTDSEIVQDTAIAQDEPDQN